MTEPISRWPLLAVLGAALAFTACAADGTLPVAGATLPTVSGSGTTQDGAALAGTWKAGARAPAGEASLTIGEPERFTAEFRDGRVSLVADCNRCTAGYVAGAGTLKTTPMACTRAYCASAPADTQFSALVSSATAWTLAGDRLELSSAAGSVRLRR